MPGTGFPTLVTKLRQAADPTAEPSQSDGRLLASFVAGRDPRAFALLVRRHGPMVLAVCRRITGHAHDAEDAFQAVFLTLARRARDVSRAEALGNWLYGVAVRTARHARAGAARRRARETPTDPLPDSGRPDPEPFPSDTRAILDEELARLPDMYRTPVVLCDLGGEPQAALARRLGVPVGTVYSRLATARALLGERLRKRGICLPAVGLTALGAAAVSPRLTRAATALATSGPIPPAVAALMNGALRTMFFQKPTACAAGAVLLGLLGCAWGALPLTPAQEPPNPSTAGLRPGEKATGEKPVPPAAKPTGPGTLLLVGEEGKLVALTPDGKENDELNTAKDAYSARHARLSPDGTRAAFVVRDETRTDNSQDPWPHKVVIRKLGQTEARVVDFPGFGVGLNWAPDGKRLAVTVTTNNQDQFGKTVLLDPETGKTEPLPLPDVFCVLDWHRDGKTFLVLYAKDKKCRLGLAEKGDKEVRELVELKKRLYYGTTARFSPDGKKVLFTDGDPDEKDAVRWDKSSKPYVLDVATGKRVPLADFPENAECVSLAWSPDGKRVAYTWMQLHPERLKRDPKIPDIHDTPTESFLIVADADGTNAKTVASGNADDELNASLASIDWR
jgi:RNA polymerase sigma factor (sigma-70 family)